MPPWSVTWKDCIPGVTEGWRKVGVHKPPLRSLAREFAQMRPACLNKCGRDGVGTSRDIRGSVAKRHVFVDFTWARRRAEMLLYVHKRAYFVRQDRDTRFPAGDCHLISRRWPSATIKIVPRDLIAHYPSLGRSNLISQKGHITTRTPLSFIRSLHLLFKLRMYYSSTVYLNLIFVWI